MFEDSIFESAGRIHTRSHEWMVAAFAFNTTILLAFVMIPLICPPALPHQVSSFLMQVFVPPKPQLPQQQPTQTARPSTEMQNGVVFAPPRIPPTIYYPAGPEPVIDEGIGSWASNSTDPAGVPFGKPGGPAVRLESKAPVRVSTTVEAGLLIQKTMPIYPPIARATRTSGTVTLAAIISKSGTIENLRVTGGPAILQQAALDAVRTWRYRPYLLDGQPVEVETTISVIFTLER